MCRKCLFMSIACRWVKIWIHMEPPTQINRNYTKTYKLKKKELDIRNLYKYFINILSNLVNTFGCYEIITMCTYRNTRKRKQLTDRLRCSQLQLLIFAFNVIDIISECRTLKSVQQLLQRSISKRNTSIQLSLSLLSHSPQRCAPIIRSHYLTYVMLIA